MIAHNEFSSHITRRLDVYLDGVHLADPVWADDQEGVVWVIARDETGKNIIPAVMAREGDICEGRSGMLSYVVVMLQGQVEIRIAERSQEEELSVEEIREILNQQGMSFGVNLEWPRNRDLLNIVKEPKTLLADGQFRIPGRNIG